MYETRSVRPYYSMLHCGVLGIPFKKLTGFAYRKMFYVTSADMHNTAYFHVQELAQSSDYFRKFWHRPVRVRKLLQEIRRRFREAERIERWGWKQRWEEGSDRQSLVAASTCYAALARVLVTMFVSQPQHVQPLEEEITALLGNDPHAAEILAVVTQHSGDLPWDAEGRELRTLHGIWESLSPDQQEQKLNALVTRYGWFNTIEGETPFDAEHYRQKIMHPPQERVPLPPTGKIPAKIRVIGKLIGELGYLRFWNRYHFMHVRYHLKNILTELVQRSSKPELAFATVEEIIQQFKGKRINMAEIRRRNGGYVSQLGKTTLLTGAKAAWYHRLVPPEEHGAREIRGSIACRGVVRGSVRVISFSAKDYHEQVSAFQKGEILVTGMTRPQIVHLCHKAAAIVTDEGGITSHAAVVSRELSIPCIIATHNATKVLKTGDVVEVDANVGVVRRLRSA